MFPLGARGKVEPARGLVLLSDASTLCGGATGRGEVNLAENDKTRLRSIKGDDRASALKRYEWDSCGRRI